MAASSTIARISDKPKLRQLSMFPDIVRCAYLVADSPKSAFYRIWIEADAGIYTVLKESGIKGRVLDKRRGTDSYNIMH